MTERKRIKLDLGDEHEAWLELAKAYGHRPATLAGAVLRQMIAEYRQSGKLEPRYVRAAGKTSDLHLRLHPDELAALDAYAERMGLSRLQALNGLLRCMVAQEIQFSLEEIAALRDSNGQLRRIGVNLNQIAKSAHAAGSTHFSEQAVRALYNRLLKQTAELDAMINVHVAKVWRLVNSARYRAKLPGQGRRRS